MANMRWPNDPPGPVRNADGSASLDLIKSTPPDHD
jgi:hypothetical protein